MLSSCNSLLYRTLKISYRSILKPLGINIPSSVLNLLTAKIKDREELAYWQSIVNKDNDELPCEHYERLMCACGNIKDKGWFSNKVVVDIGCGPAGSLNWCETAKYRIGIDPLSEKYRAFDINEHNMIYLNCPAERIPLISGSVDVVFSINSLDHVQNIDNTIREIRRILRPGGQFILSANLFEEANPREPHRLTPESLEVMLSDGFQAEWSKTGPHPIAVKSVKGFDGEKFAKDSPLFGYQYLFYDGSAVITADDTLSHIMWCRYKAV